MVLKPYNFRLPLTAVLTKLPSLFKLVYFMNSLKRHKSYLFPLLLLMAMVIGLLSGGGHTTLAYKQDVVRKYSHAPSKTLIGFENHLLLDDNQEESDEDHCSITICSWANEVFVQVSPIIHSFEKTSLHRSSLLSSRLQLFLLFCTYLI